jgi:hypothetical protein
MLKISNQSESVLVCKREITCLLLCTRNDGKNTAAMADFSRDKSCALCQAVLDTKCDNHFVVIRSDVIGPSGKNWFHKSGIQNRLKHTMGRTGSNCTGSHSATENCHLTNCVGIIDTCLESYQSAGRLLGISDLWNPNHYPPEHCLLIWKKR